MDNFPQFDVTDRLSGGLHHSIVQVIREDLSQYWPRHFPLGNTASNQPPVVLGMDDHFVQAPWTFWLSTEFVVHLSHYVSVVWLQGCLGPPSKISRCLCCFHLLQQGGCLIIADSQVSQTQFALGKSILAVPSHPLVSHVPGHCFQVDLLLNFTMGWGLADWSAAACVLLASLVDGLDMWCRNNVARWLPSFTPQLQSVAGAWKKCKMFRYDS